MFIYWLNNLGMGASSATPPDVHGHMDLGFTTTSITLTHAYRNAGSEMGYEILNVETTLEVI